MFFANSTFLGCFEENLHPSRGLNPTASSFYWRVFSCQETLNWVICFRNEMFIEFLPRLNFSLSFFLIVVFFASCHRKRVETLHGVELFRSHENCAVWFDREAGVGQRGDIFRSLSLKRTKIRPFELCTERSRTDVFSSSASADLRQRRALYIAQLLCS